MPARIEHIEALGDPYAWADLAPIVPMPADDVLSGAWHAGRIESLCWDKLDRGTMAEVHRYKAASIAPAKMYRFAPRSLATSSST